MKLLAKINFRYLLSSLIIMTFSGIVLYFVLSEVIAEQFDEKMDHTLKSVTRQIENTGEFYSNPPFTEVMKLESDAEEYYYSDTLLLYGSSFHGEKFRQLTSEMNINGKGYRIIIRESKLELDDLLESVILVILATFIFLTFSLFLVNRQVAKSVWRPFYQNLQAVRNFSLKNMETISLKETSIYEFDELNNVLISLTEKILGDYQNLKQFSEDASHEIQSPLAIIKTKLEVLLNYPDLDKNQMDKLRSIFSAINRLSRLNKDLILLTKIENKQFPDLEPINLRQVVEKKLEDFQELFRLKDIDLLISLNGNPVIKMDPSLADILINNLLTNAINHSDPKAAIYIDMDDRSLVIRNQGTSAISHPENIFKRFSKGESSSRSVGLGLAIVKKICDIHNIDISYLYKQSMHCFRLDFHL